MNRPQWIKHWRIDEAIECLSEFSEDARIMRKGLMRVCPDAYDAETPRNAFEALEIVEFSAEGRNKRFAISKYWDLLSGAEQRAVAELGKRHGMK